jgi:hypothetical protein
VSPAIPQCLRRRIACTAPPFRSKKRKKACHSFTHPVNPGNQKKEKRVDAFLVFQLKATFSHLNSIHTITQLHEKEIRFTIRTCPP